MAGGSQRQIRLALRELDRYVPAPWSIDQLIADLAAARGRLIEVVPWPLWTKIGDPSGMWIPSENIDHLFYDEKANTPERDQILGHEVGHVVMKHAPRLVEAPDDLLRALFPSLLPALARRVLARGRTGYGDHEEAAAEEFGTRLRLLGKRKRRLGASDELGRLTDIL